MAEAEAKLQSNGRTHAKALGMAPKQAPQAGDAAPRGVAVSPSQAGAAAPECSDAVEDEDPPAAATPNDVMRALTRLRGALESADGQLSDAQGRGYLGAHTPGWSTKPAWTVDADANAGLRSMLKPVELKRGPWPLTEHLRRASDAALGDVGATASAALRSAALPQKYWGDVHARLRRRYASPPALRPAPWAHATDLALPPDAAGHRHLAKVGTVKKAPPPRPRSASTGRISLAFSSPARNQYAVQLSVGAQLLPAGMDATVSSAAVVVRRSWTVAAPERLAGCARDPDVACAAPAGVWTDAPVPMQAERTHDPDAPRRSTAGKASACVASHDSSPLQEPYAPPALRPSRELALPSMVDEPCCSSARAKPQRGPHVVRRKSRRMPTLKLLLQPAGGAGAPPPQAPGTQSADMRPRALQLQPASAPSGDAECWADGEVSAPSQSLGFRFLPPPHQAPHHLVLPAPPPPLPARPARCPAVKAQPELAYAPRDDPATARAGGKRWRRRARAERTDVQTRRKVRVQLTRWEAACVIQAHFRGMEARRLISAVKARIMLSTHLSEKAVTGKSGDGQLPTAALRHVKVLAEFYEQSSQRRRFHEAAQHARARAAAATSLPSGGSSAPAALTRRGQPPPLVAAMPERPNPLLRIYETQGEAAALEAAAREALTWTNWMVPDLAKHAEEDATLAAVRAFRDMLKEGETVRDSREMANRIALKAAAEVVAPAMAELTAHGLAADHYSSANATVANRVRDGKAASGSAHARGVPAVAHSAAAAAAFAKHFDKVKQDPRSFKHVLGPPQPLAPPPGVPAVGVKQRLVAAPTAKLPTPAASLKAPSPAASLKDAPSSTPAAPTVHAKPSRQDRSWLESAASLFGVGRPSAAAQTAAATRIQAAVRAQRARRLLAILRARSELRQAVSAVRDRGIAAQPAVLEKTTALGDAYLRAWNLPRAEQCYSHVLETMERDYGRGDPRTVRPASALARLYRERGETQRAEEVMRRATSRAAPKDVFSSLGGLFGVAPVAAAAPPSTGSKALDSAAAQAADAFASSTKAVQEQFGALFGGGWLSSRPVESA